MQHCGALKTKFIHEEHNNQTVERRLEIGTIPEW